MAAPLFLRAIPLLSLRLHHHHHRLAAPILAPARRPWCSAAEPSRGDENLSSADNITAAWSARDSVSPKYHRWNDDEYRKWKDKEDEILRDIEPIASLTKEILHSERYLDGEQLTAEDEKAVVDKLLAYHPHSEDKIGCGLDSIMLYQHISETETDRRKSNELYESPSHIFQAIEEQLYQHISETETDRRKSNELYESPSHIFQAIEEQVDRHPQFKRSRCLFVIRTDGGWIDFSYQKCLRAYIRDKYPSNAERFIREHFKRGSG